jgi:uncharacterized protein
MTQQPYDDVTPPTGSQPTGSQPTGSQPAGQPWQASPPVPLRPDEERTWGSMAHLLTIPAMIVGMAFLAPLVILLVWGGRSAWVRRQSMESLNFQITALIVGATGVLLGIVTLGLGFLIVGPVLLAYGIFWLVCILLATAAAGRGEDYRYPLTLRFLR